PSEMVNWDATAVPPLSLITCLMTLRFPRFRLFVIVHTLVPAATTENVPPAVISTPLQTMLCNAHGDASVPSVSVKLAPGTTFRMRSASPSPVRVAWHCARSAFVHVESGALKKMFAPPLASVYGKTPVAPEGTVTFVTCTAPQFETGGNA